jgi:antitoxin MazE
MNIIQTLQQWGNSTAVRLPKRILQEARLEPYQKVRIAVQDGSILLTPLDHPSKLEQLLENVTPERVGGELEWGPDMGAEEYA